MIANRDPNKQVRLLVGMRGVMCALSIGKTKAFQLVQSGELPSVTVGRRRLVSIVELERYVERLAAEASPSRSTESAVTKREAARSSRKRHQPD
jgi:excisionase family DNA binding protein